MIATATELARGVVKLLSLPTAYLRLSELLQDPTTSAEDLGAVVRYDPGMSSRLLRIVNSPLYGFPDEIDSVSRAIAIIGTRQFEDLILATTAVDTFGKIPNELFEMSKFWEHSVLCALASRSLARRCSVLDGERLFVAGLLHDVGKLVIFNKLPDLAQEALEIAQTPAHGLHIAEQQVFGFTHGDVGSELFTRWGLPASLQAVARFHHRPTEARIFSFETAIVHLADTVVNRAESYHDVADELPRHEPAAWERIGVSKNILGEVLAEVNDQFTTVLDVISPSTVRHKRA